MSRRRRRLAALAALLVLAAVPMSSCGGARERAASPTGPVTVGVVTPLSGDAEALGAAVRRGAELALDALDGAPVRLAFADAGSGPQTATAALAELAGGGARAIVAGVEATHADALVAAARDAGVTLVIPQAGNDDAVDVFRLGPAPARGIRLLEELLAARPAWRRLAVVRAGGGSDPATENLASALGAAADATGRVLVDSEPSEPSDPADPADPAELPDSPDVDAIAILGDAAGVAAELPRAADTASGRPLLALVAGDDPALFDPAARAAAGLELRATPDDGEETIAAIERFAERYAERHGAPAGVWAAFGHDAVTLIARAAAASDGSSAGIAEALRALGPVAGALGVTRFGTDGSGRSALHLTAPLDGQAARRLAIWPVGTGLPAPERLRLAANQGMEPAAETSETGTPSGGADTPPASPSAVASTVPSTAAPAPAATREPLVALYDFQGAERPLARAVAENLRAEGWNVRLAPATAGAALPRLGSAHLYRREETADALDAAAAIAIAAGMDVRMHPWMETGQEDIRQLLRSDDEADFVIVLN